MRAKPVMIFLPGAAMAMVLVGCKGEDEDHFVPPVSGVVSTVESVSVPPKDEFGESATNER